RQTRAAERAAPPRGRFVTVDGVRLHFSVHGRDESPQTVVLLHGSGLTAEEMALSGLVEPLAQRYRVVVIERPGHGHSEQARASDPREQADLIHAALARLGVADPIVVGHSWGALVALAMGLRHGRDVGSLVLMSGYYFPSLRLDRPLLAASALPLLGPLLRHTLSPLVGRLLWPLARWRMFSPGAAPAAFRARYPVWMSLRPSQLAASAAEAAALLPAVRALGPHYGELQVPAVLVAGGSDRVLSTRWHSARLHDELERSWLRVVEGAGHMVHHAAARQVVAAVDQAAAMVWDRSLLLRPSTGLKAGEVPAPAPRPMPLPCTASRL
ncbi:MAG TPA: alpha/beta hydrolase, partial [Albitalea sp.]|nr:alpha/beta hydrolase [Albitalea sp.]